MLSTQMETLLSVVEQGSFTRAAEALSLTQPAVSHHIRQLEQDLNIPIFIRGKGALKLTDKGEIAVKYARRLKAMEQKMFLELQNADRHLTSLRVGITHTSESNITTQALAKCSSSHPGLSITITTDTINNLYTMLGNYELDLAFVEGPGVNVGFRSLMLDTDFLVCVMAVNNPLAKNALVTLADLKKQQMILRLPSSATRMLFESALLSINESIDAFNVIIQVDNIATIKDLVRKELGVSILPRSACMDELSKGKLAALPIENLSMVRETRIAYNGDFSHMDIMQEIIREYRETARMYR